MNDNEKNPIILPGHHHVTALLIKHNHEQTRRLLTEGAVRAAGWWIVGGKRNTTCKRLHAPVSTQKMFDLPSDHLSTDPLFTNMDIDVFGP